MAKVSRYPELMQLKLPRGAGEALDRLASMQMQTRSESVRQCLFQKLHRAGIDLSSSEAEPEPEKVLQA